MDLWKILVLGTLLLNCNCDYDVAEAKHKFGDLSCCSFDKGFYSPTNRHNLRQILDYVVLPKKGKLSKAEKQIEY